MREILFRGKRTDGKGWIEGYLVKTKWYYNESPMTIIIPTDSTLYPRCDIGYFEPVIPETVGQFTGVLDTNGNKIFEGDILRFHNDYNGDKHPFDGLVTFKDGAFVSYFVCIDDTEGMYNHFDCWNIPLVWWEIIGNIHDNPELMKGE